MSKRDHDDEITIEVEDVVDESFEEEAVKALGPYRGPRDL
jgi:hypothetical protein